MSRQSGRRGGTNPFASESTNSNPFDDDDVPPPPPRRSSGGSSRPPRRSGGGGGGVGGGSSSNNPFEDGARGGGGGGSRPAPVRRSRTEQGPRSASSSFSSNNPFDDDDGGAGNNNSNNNNNSNAGPQNRAANLARGARGLINRASGAAAAAGANDGGGGGGSSSSGRPAALGRGGRARTSGAAVPGENTQSFAVGVEKAKDNLAGLLKRNKDMDGAGGGGAGGGGNYYEEPKPWEDDQAGQVGQDDPGSSTSRRKKGKGGGKGGVQRWPYDDYHTEQQRMYDEAQENNADDYYSDEKKSATDAEAALMAAEAAENQFYERPPELPGIKEAVQGVSLVDFERKAEERAVNIVSTWLYDAGLIDELLMNGAVGPASAASPDATGGGVDDSEGIEVGMRGFPLGGADGALKMDKEIEKLRASAQRELGLINARLNDGVAASGAEVQELVNAVTVTKSDLGKLRQLCTYITDSASSGVGAAASGAVGPHGAVTEKDEFILTRYPRLKAAINARRNLFRCFRELEFFSHIPSTCDRLRDELHSGEWTADEWNTIRNVCMEHVELEILLVEAEMGMKAMFDEGDDESGRSGGRRGVMQTGPSSRLLRQQMRSKRMSDRGWTQGGRNYEMVDNFLSQHVKNVWELGDEIRMRILSGIGSSFDLALNNPAGMVALVEAVEVYERANDQYKALHEEDDMPNQTLHFTDMRAAALAQIYQDFELRGLEVFRGVHMQAADTADEDQGLNAQFTAVLRAATELVAEIELVKSDISPCFPPHWAIEVLWSACVAHVCSNQIIQQIGGPDGHALPDLTVTQLLDLVAWVEFFRETVEEMFPAVATMHATQKAADFEKKPDLFASSGKEVDMDTATDNLAWVNNMLWEVHRLAQEEFLVRTRTQSEEWLQNVYNADHSKNQSADGKLTTSLCEDVFSLAAVQVTTIRERLSKKSEALVMAVCLIFSMMRSKQIHARDGFLQDLETCCAASNDFTRMSEKVEEVVQELSDECEFTEQDVATLEASSGELLAVYSADAVYAAQSVHIYIFEPIREAIVEELFGPDWEENLTHNELALTLTRTLEDFMGDLEQFIDDFMLKKAVDSLVSSSVVFYVKCLLETAEKHRSNKESFFISNHKALERISGDIKVMRQYFDGLVEDMPALRKVIEKEFEILTTMLELMSIAAEITDSDASDFILVMHKKIQDIDLTKHAVGDLWHLVNPTQERAVWELVESMEDTLLAVVPPDASLAQQAMDRSQVPGLRLDEMMAMHYIDSKRRRPVKPGAVERMRKMWGQEVVGEGEDQEGVDGEEYAASP